MRMSLDKNWMWYFSFNVCMQLQKVYYHVLPLSCMRRVERGFDPQTLSAIENTTPSTTDRIEREESGTRVQSTITIAIHHRDTTTSTTDRINRNHCCMRRVKRGFDPRSRSRFIIGILPLQRLIVSTETTPATHQIIRNQTAWEIGLRKAFRISKREGRSITVYQHCRCHRCVYPTDCQDRYQ